MSFPSPLPNLNYQTNHLKRKLDETKETADIADGQLVNSILQKLAAETLARMDSELSRDKIINQESALHPSSESIDEDEFVASLLNDPDAPLGLTLPEEDSRSYTVESIAGDTSSSEPNYLTAFAPYLNRIPPVSSLPQKSPLELFQKILQPTVCPNNDASERRQTSAPQTPYMERSSDSNSGPSSCSTKTLHSPIICAIDLITIASGKEILKIVATEDGMFAFTNSTPKVIFEYNFKTKNTSQYCIDCEDIFHVPGWLITNCSKKKVQLFKSGETLSYSHSLPGKQILPDCKSITAIAVYQRFITVGFNGGTLGFFDVEAANKPSGYSFADKKLHIKDIVLNENFMIVRSSTRIFYSARHNFNFLQLTTCKKPIEKMAIHNSLLYVSSNGMILIYDLLERKQLNELNIGTNHSIIGLMPDNHGIYAVTSKKFIYISNNSEIREMLAFKDNSFTSMDMKGSLIFLGTLTGDVLIFSTTPVNNL